VAFDRAFLCPTSQLAYFFKGDREGDRYVTERNKIKGDIVLAAVRRGRVSGAHFGSEATETVRCRASGIVPSTGLTLASADLSA
jgi:hypothetical protein